METFIFIIPPPSGSALYHSPQREEENKGQTRWGKGAKRRPPYHSFHPMVRFSIIPSPRRGGNDRVWGEGWEG